jgi:hypothetical protein
MQLPNICKLKTLVLRGEGFFKRGNPQTRKLEIQPSLPIQHRVVNSVQDHQIASREWAAACVDLGVW